MSRCRLRPFGCSHATRSGSEDLARIVGFEPAMRMDLSGSMGNTLDASKPRGRWNGREPVRVSWRRRQTAGWRRRQFRPWRRLSLAAAQLAKGVDGKFAGNEGDCAVVIGVDTYETLASKFQTGSGVAATTYAAKSLKAFQASANIPDKNEFKRPGWHPCAPGR